MLLTIALTDALYSTATVSCPSSLLSTATLEIELR